MKQHTKLCLHCNAPYEGPTRRPGTCSFNCQRLRRLQQAAAYYYRSDYKKKWSREYYQRNKEELTARRRDNTRKAHPCRSCGQAFTRGVGMRCYCSDACREVGARQSRIRSNAKRNEKRAQESLNRKPVLRACIQCSAEFEAFGVQAIARRYCSETCREKARYERESARLAQTYPAVKIRRIQAAQAKRPQTPTQQTQPTAPVMLTQQRRTPAWLKTTQF